MVVRAFILASLAFVCACPPAKPPPQADIQVVMPFGDCPGVNATTAVVCAFDYGVVASAAGAQQTFQVANRGDGPGTVTNIALNGDPFFTIIGDPPGEVGAGGQVALVVEAKPTAVNPDGSAAVVQTELALTWIEPEAVIQLHFTAQGDNVVAHLGVSPATCNAGNVPVGQVGHCSVTLSNTGGADLVISSVDLTDANGVFTQDNAITDATVTPGNNVVASFTATPTLTGDFSGHFTVSSNDPDNSTRIVTLNVSGT